MTTRVRLEMLPEAWADGYAAGVRDALAAAGKINPSVRAGILAAAIGGAYSAPEAHALAERAAAALRQSAEPERDA